MSWPFLPGERYTADVEDYGDTHECCCVAVEENYERDVVWHGGQSWLEVEEVENTHWKTGLVKTWWGVLASHLGSTRCWRGVCPQRLAGGGRWRAPGASWRGRAGWRPLCRRGRSAGGWKWRWCPGRTARSRGKCCFSCSPQDSSPAATPCCPCRAWGPPRSPGRRTAPAQSAPRGQSSFQTWACRCDYREATVCGIFNITHTSHHPHHPPQH